MNLNYFTDRFLVTLRHAVPVNLPKYTSAETWIAAYAGAQRYAWETGVEVSDLPPLMPPDDEGTHDAENAIRLHRATAMLTPVQAMDERLWACLSHCVWWEYMVQRWSPNVGNPGRAAKFVIRRYFLESRGLRGLATNGLSRLWWAGHLTHDPARDDPYELTRVLMGKADIATGLLERSIGKNRHLLSHVLQFLRDHMSEIELKWKSIGGPGRAVQQMVRDMNRRGGVVLLDAEDRDGIYRILQSAMEPHRFKS